MVLFLHNTRKWKRKRIVLVEAGTVEVFLAVLSIARPSYLGSPVLALL
jgi:hypothetical protein